MKDIFIRINNVETHVITWGNPENTNGLDVVVCVTGNPGIPDFYTEFGAELHRNTQFPVCVIGQAGHEIVPDEESNILKGKEYLFNLKGQLKHKSDFINNYIDKNCKLHLIGHSVGAWLLLEILQHNDLLGRVKSINLLFPTIQRMAESKNGVFINNFTRKIHTICIILSTLFNLLPLIFRVFFVKLYLMFKSYPQELCDRILKLLNPTVVKKVLLMAYEEMDVITILNKSALNNVKHLCNVIYSTNDGWAPLEYMNDLKEFQPELQMKEVDIIHTFVLDSSERVAEMVTDFIKTRLRT